MGFFEIETSSGKIVVVETDSDAEDLRLASSSAASADGTKKMIAAINSVRPAVDDLVAAFGSLARQPDELEIEFGLKLNGEVGALIAKTSTEANFSVTVKWVRPSAES
ncbi:MAG: CU044_2847 family protein [Pseudomonadota bacterium]